jgi:hypothetical protein
MRRVPTASAEAVTLPCSNPWKERRQRERLELCLPAYIRPVYSEQERLESVTSTLDFNRNVLRFFTLLNHYYLGMILYVTFPYSSVIPAWKGYLAEIVRIDCLSNGSQAVAVRFLY